MDNEVAIDPEKVKEIINYLSSYLLTLPEYNDIRADVQEKIMNLYDLQSKKSITEAERDKYNGILQQAEAPEYLMF
jgi:hypothetical protein